MYNLNSYLDFVGKGNKCETCAAAVPVSSAKHGNCFVHRVAVANRDFVSLDAKADTYS